ncbi:hypothetical protein EH223_10820 [candidate division KSB1 bacterium]|nr:hypothetical protein [candidate division KSB1 bacterium]RQW03113.1 MAG: hypothetical protein EH223_10820 [candidate division KSB1 bacterium]
MITQYDHLEIRCPMLGHPLKFFYCRTTDGNTPCRRIFNCWYQRIAVQDFVYDHFPQEIIATITAPPKPKMLSLVELIQKAQQSKKNGGIPQKDVMLSSDVTPPDS